LQIVDLFGFSGVARKTSHILLHGFLGVGAAKPLGQRRHSVRHDAELGHDPTINLDT
jgi:hypothetical protein